MHISTVADFSILPVFDVFFIFPLKKSALFLGKIKKREKRVKSKNPPQYLCACSLYLTFKTSLVKKYSEQNFEKKTRKKMFGSSGIAPKWKKVEKFDF